MPAPAKTDQAPLMESVHIEAKTEIVKAKMKCKMVQEKATRGIKSVTMDTKKEFVDIEIEGREGSQRLPAIWLRDNCQCPECFHPISKSRLLHMRELRQKAHLKEAKVVNGKLVLTWEDGHISEFTLAWLEPRLFTSETRERETRLWKVEQRLWRREDMHDQITRVDFKTVMRSDEECLRWLLAIERDGLCLVTGAPARPGVVKQICERVYFPKKTHYGEVFLVKIKNDPSNVAYAPGLLELHVDLPHTEYVPSVQLLHCIKPATTGGENMLTDSFRVAEDLKIEHPEHFEVLTQTNVDFQDRGTDGGLAFQTKMRRKTIQLNEDGQIEQVAWNNFARDSAFCVEPEQAKRFYDALLCYDEMLNDDKYCLEYMLKPGEIVCFHNTRVLHGRQAYKMEGDDERVLEGCYLDWDGIRSTRRVLSGKLNKGQ